MIKKILDYNIILIILFSCVLCGLMYLTSQTAARDTFANWDERAEPNHFVLHYSEIRVSAVTSSLIANGLISNQKNIQLIQKIRIFKNFSDNIVIFNSLISFDENYGSESYQKIFSNYRMLCIFISINYQFLRRMIIFNQHFWYVRKYITVLNIYKWIYLSVNIVLLLHTKFIITSIFFKYLFSGWP